MLSMSSKEIIKARKLSPAIDRYLNLLESPRHKEDGMSSLRVQRHRDWLVAASQSLLKTQSPYEICRQWSHAADRLIDQAWDLAGGTSLDVAIFALGKLGAEELNLSSDVDLLFVSQNPADHETMKAVRSFRNILSENTSLGFCLRVDTDLRPGGRLGPVVSSLNQFEDYYWNQGSTWERLALIRLRALTGPDTLRQGVLDIARHFIFRKFIDYSLVEELKSLRSSIQQNYARPSSQQFHLKLGIGGIRDIELFVQSLMVIHGGRLPDLPTHSTEEIFLRLKEKKLFDPSDLNFLHQTYWEFRQIENVIQSQNDQQTHTWNFNDHFVQTFGYNSLETTEKAQRVNAIVSQLLGPPDLEKTRPPTGLEEQKEWLLEKGFKKQTIEGTWASLQEATALSSQSQRDEEARQQFLYLFVEELNQTALDQDLGLQLLFDFIQATRAKASFFSLFLHKPKLIHHLALLFGCSPYLGGIIASRPELVDSFVFHTQDFSHRDMDELLELLTERRLLSEILAGTEFLSTREINPLLSSLSSAADEISMKLLERLHSDLGSDQLEILCLGKWGGQEMGFKSDLDFVFIHPGKPTGTDHQIARRFISRMTEQHRGGAIYSIDMRLRPSGSVGPMMLTEQSLIEHLSHQAEAWERQSYLRSRYLGKQSCHAIRRACVLKGLSDQDLCELKKIRHQLIRPPRKQKLDLKLCPGGLIEIEFAVQLSFLAQGTVPQSSQTLDGIDQLKDMSSPWRGLSDEIKSHYRILRSIEQLYQLVSGLSGSEIHFSSSAFQRLAHLHKLKPEELHRKILRYLKRNVEILNQLDPLKLGI